MRLDAMARFLQDAATDDVDDAGLDEPAWVVRRTWLQVFGFPRYKDDVEVTTFCWSMGSRYAERRTGLLAASGRVESLTLWVRLDPETGRPRALCRRFRELYEDAVAGRETDHRLRLPDAPDHLPRAPWPLRPSDLDIAGHVNNTVYWTALEDQLGAAVLRPPINFRMEFRTPIAAVCDVGLVRQQVGDRLSLWLASDRTHAAAEIWPCAAPVSARPLHDPRRRTAGA